MISVMMLRGERTTGRAIGPAARLAAEAALTALTRAGGWFTFEEAVKGRLESGHYADCAVLSRDPLAVDPRELESVACLATMVGGAFVHRAG